MSCTFLFSFFGLGGLVLLTAGCTTRTRFELVSASHTGIRFNNLITESDSMNVFNQSNMYNGGGVGIGDFNNDGLPDVYFTGNMVSNRLYLNMGDLHFKDITDEAGVGGGGEWCRGVSVVDINNDGWLDIYVCATLSRDSSRRRNLLYVNQGMDKNGIPHFKEMAMEYGLDACVYSTMAAFFDYDNDGDLDMYLAVNEIRPTQNPNQYRPIHRDGSFPSTGRLYRNDWSDSLKHPVFSDVSKKAGISLEGYSHGVTIADINQDGWKDIYVSNDFVSNDILYINNHDGTFTDRLATYCKHTSANAMGQEIEDINNDGLADIIVLDMNPEDNYRKKTMMNPGNYRNYQNEDSFGYTRQYVRNTLQLNQGPRVGQEDSIGTPIFSEIGWYAGIAETDWSWAPLVVDFDNDGLRDILITNGYAKDVTDRDFIAFRNKASKLVSRKELLSMIPEVKLSHYAFKNTGDCRFANVSADWGFTAPGFANGAAYADLDGDGDLDLVINNINDQAMVYRNLTREKDRSVSHYLSVRFAGDALNRNGLGASVELHYGKGSQQVYENSPYRGYLSSIEAKAHFGLGMNTRIDTVLVKWPDGKEELIKNVSADQLLTLRIGDARFPASPLPDPGWTNHSLFKEITSAAGIQYTPPEKDFVDFDIQGLLPHKFSEYGPGLAVGDVDGNGLDDIVCGGSAHYSAQLFLQQADGRFIQKPLVSDVQAILKNADDLGLLFFDADGDGDPDLYITGGGYEHPSGSRDYRDRLYINDGHGNFKEDSNALPVNFASKFCVRAVDYDHDGDLDLFVSGRVDPGHYPSPVSSYIYRNDSKNGQILFTDVTTLVAPELVNIGMVCDALWTDFDNDGWPDLVLAGEWMPVVFLKNEQGVFKKINAGASVSGRTGWWNSITAGDFDHDGDMDYIVGNLGGNSFYRAGESEPLRVYGKDMDSNGIYDMIPSLYLPDRAGNKKEFPAFGWDELVRQLPGLRKNFPDYKSFATATMDELIPADRRKGMLMLAANTFQTSLLRNDGNGKFTMMPLPWQAQLSVINGMQVGDFDGDGNPDIVMSGNDFGADPSAGRSDAFNGLMLKGDGRGNFSAQSILQSGIFIPGNGRALVALRSAGGKFLLAASQNRGPLKIFRLERKVQMVSLRGDDASVMITYKNGRSAKQEIYYGNSFLSSSARFVIIDSTVSHLTVTNTRGNKRDIPLIEPLNIR